jgi:hypothetical protein
MTVDQRSIAKGSRRKILPTLGLILLWTVMVFAAVFAEARLQIAQNRLMPASVAIIAGAIALSLWKLTRKQPAQLK